MRKISFVLLILICTCLANANVSCYWVVFTDKANTQFNPYQYFDAKAIERREKLGLSLYDISDYPLNNEYVNAVSGLAEELVGESRWLNAVGIMLDDSKLVQVQNFPFVKEVVKIESDMQLASYKSKYEVSDEMNIADYEMLKPELAMQLERMQGAMFAENNIDGKGVRIAVFDGGFPDVDKHFAFSHLRDNKQIVKTWNFPNKKENVYGWNSHGTMTLSCIAGVQFTDIKNRVLGLATGAEFLLARTEVEAEPFKEEIWWAQAVEWADKNGADIISSSLGYGKDRYYTKSMNGDSYVARAANMAARKGILVCNSMGNEASDRNWETIITPADADSVLAVGGIEASLTEYKHINFSSIGPTADGRRKPNVVAFGLAYVADKNNKITTAYGTSFSCPLVAGFAACAWQTNRSLTAMELFKEIEKSGDLYPYYDYALGHGVPQASYFVDKQKSNTANEPTFELILEDNSYKIIPKNYPTNKQLFYNIVAPSGAILKYEHIDVDDDATITLDGINNYGACTLNVYYQAYVVSRKIEETADINNYTRFYTRLDKAKSDLSRTKARNDRMYKRRRLYSYSQLNIGVAGIKTLEESTNKTRSSFAFTTGLRFEACKLYSLCFGIGIGFDDYRGSNLAGLNLENIRKEKERFRSPFLQAEFKQELQLARGIPVIWEAGVFGAFNFANQYRYFIDADNQSYKSMRVSCRKFNFVNKWQWGVQTAIGFKYLSVYGKLRLSDLLNNEYQGSYSDFQKFEIGLQLKFHF